MNWNEILQRYDGKRVIHNGNIQHVRIEIDQLKRTTDLYISIFVFGFNRLRLVAEYSADKNSILIRDIETKKQDRNFGYGSTAMDVLLEIGSHINVDKYTGFLSKRDLCDPDDPEHKNRLVHFYQKSGFDVDLDNSFIERFETENLSS